MHSISCLFFKFFLHVKRFFCYFPPQAHFNFYKIRLLVTSCMSIISALSELLFVYSVVWQILFFFFCLPVSVTPFFLPAFCSNQQIVLCSLKMENWLINIRLSTNSSVFLPSPCLICVKLCHTHFLCSYSRFSGFVKALLLVTAVLLYEKFLPDEVLPNQVMSEQCNPFYCTPFWWHPQRGAITAFPIYPQ